MDVDIEVAKTLTAKFELFCCKVPLTLELLTLFFPGVSPYY